MFILCSHIPRLASQKNENEPEGGGGEEGDYFFLRILFDEVFNDVVRGGYRLRLFCFEKLNKFFVQISG